VVSQTDRPLADGSSTRQILAGGVWVAFGKTAFAITGIAMNAVLARCLAPRDMGTYFLAFSLVGMFVTTTVLGLGRSAVRFIGQAHVGQHADTCKTLFVVAVAGGATSLLGLVVLGGPVGVWIAVDLLRSEDLGALMPLVAKWGVVMALQFLVAESFRGLKRMAETSIFGDHVLQRLILIAVLLAVARFLPGGLSVRRVVALVLGVSVMSMLLSLILLLKRIGRFSLRGNRIAARAILTTAWPIWLSGALLFSFGQANMWILSAVSSATDVALFGAALRLTTLVAFPLVIANGVLHPHLAYRYAHGYVRETEALMRTSAVVVLLPSLAAFAVVAGAGKPLLGMVFGDFYSSAWLSMLVLSAAHVLSAATGSPGVLLNMSGRQHVPLIAGVVACALGIGLTLALAPRWGHQGAALGAAVSIVTHNIIMMGYCARAMRIRTFAETRTCELRRLHSAIRRFRGFQGAP